MLKPIKIFYSETNPTYSIFEEAKQIAIKDHMVETPEASRNLQM